MKSFLLFLISILIVLSSCGTNREESQVTTLNLPEAFSQRQEVLLSRFIDKISYVPLETKPDLVLARMARFEVTDDFIIVRNVGLGQKPQILLFDRNTGRFIKEIGKQGRGPGEYENISFLPFNSSKNEIYAEGPSRELLVYDIYGKYIDKIKIPQWIDDKAPDNHNRKTSYPDNMLDKNIFASYVLNSSGKEQRKMVLFTKEGIFKIFPNSQTYTRNDWGFSASTAGGYAKFYRWANNLYFIEIFCDTLYHVTKNELKPRYYFDCGKYKALYSKQEEILANRNTPEYFFISDIDESKDYIFMQLQYNKGNYTGFIEKKTNKITFCKKDIPGISGLKDDINGLMDVVPKDFTQNNEMVYLIQPVDLFKWFELNPEKAIYAKTKLPWINNIDELSNPIIAIGKCKD